jgi:hypothetical protein
MKKLILAAAMIAVLAVPVQADSLSIGTKIVPAHPIAACRHLDAAYHINGLIQQIGAYTGMHSIRLMQTTPQWNVVREFMSSQGDDCADLIPNKQWRIVDRVGGGMYCLIIDQAYDVSNADAPKPSAEEQKQQEKKYCYWAELNQ